MPGVIATTGLTTTQDIVLLPATTMRSPAMSPTDTGWPLYASIDIAGYPGDPVWTDPEDRRTTASIWPRVWTTPSPSMRGSTATNLASRAVGSLTANLTEDFALDAPTAS